MFGLAPSELLIILVVALICIGPSDLPRAMKTAARWMNAGRKLAREFQGHVDELVREADLEELRDQARKLSSQSLTSHIESALDPDRELSNALAPPDFFHTPEPPAAVSTPGTEEPMLPGLTAEVPSAPAVPETLHASAVEAQAEPSESVAAANHGG